MANSSRKIPDIRSQHEPALVVGDLSFWNLDVAGLDELSPENRAKVSRIVKATVPGAAVIGALKGSRVWDIRPVVLHPADNGLPSFIRFFSPESVLVPPIASRTLNLLSRAVEARAAQITGSGEFESQIWARRLVGHCVLADRLRSNEILRLTDALDLALRIFRSLRALHQEGLVHGHISTGNITLDEHGEPAIVDAFFEAASVQALATLGRDPFAGGNGTFAPELPFDRACSPALDLYGFGTVLKALCMRAEQTESIRRDSGAPGPHIMRNIAQPLRELVLAVTAREPSDRPDAAAVFAALENLQRGSSALSPSEQPKPPEPKSREEAKPHRELPTAISSRRRQTVKIEDVVNVRAAVAHEEPAPRAAKRAEERPEEKLDWGIEKKSQENFEENFEESFEQEPQEEHENLFAGLEQHLVEEPAEHPEKKAPKRRERLPVEEEGSFAIPEEAFASDLDEVLAPAPKRKKALNLLAGLVLAAGVAALAVARVPESIGSLIPASFSGQARELTDQELQAAWESGVPSEMKPVALAALKKDDPNPFARVLILKSAREGSAKNDAVDSFLLRIAFDKQWEISLTPSDRRAALALALRALVDENDIGEMPDLQQLHPGVLLAITTTQGRTASRILSKIPASTFTELPSPLRIAFTQLLAAHPQLTLGDEAAQELAQLAVRTRLRIGTAPGKEDIVNFLSKEYDLRIKVLAFLLAFDHDLARRAVEIVINAEPPISGSSDETSKWARAAGLMSWESIGGSDQLLILAGLDPAEPVSDDEVVLLARHPSPGIKLYAIKRAQSSESFNHPAKNEVLADLQANPALLTAEQFFGLFRILRNPAKVSVESIKKWLATKPPMALAEKLLIGSAPSAEGTNFDFFLSQYLQEIGWNPNIGMLEKIAVHPDRLTRFFAYTKLYAYPKHKTAMRVLVKALEKEKDEEYRKQLELMLSVMKGRDD